MTQSNRIFLKALIFEELQNSKNAIRSGNPPKFVFVEKNILHVVENYYKTLIVDKSKQLILREDLLSLAKELNTIGVSFLSDKTESVDPMELGLGQAMPTETLSSSSSSSSSLSTNQEIPSSISISSTQADLLEEDESLLLSDKGKTRQEHDRTAKLTSDTQAPPKDRQTEVCAQGDPSNSPLRALSLCNNQKNKKNQKKRKFENNESNDKEVNFQGP